MSKPDHTAREVHDVLVDHFGESHANHLSRARRGANVDGLFLTPVNGCDYDEHDDIHTWHGDVEDAETGEIIGKWTVPDHWPDEPHVVWL